jgi:ABC-type sulfate transport system substrate-binding protein
MKLRMTALTVLSLLALGQVQAAEVRLLNVSYDPTRSCSKDTMPLPRSGRPKPATMWW